MWQVVSGVFLGWSLGTNDAANVFGTAVASRMVRFWTAAIICSVFIVLGAVLEGQGGMDTYRSLSGTSLNTAFLVGLFSALTVAVMTYLKYPVSTSQAVVGALLAIGTWSGKAEYGVLGKVVACWVGTPIGALLLAIVLYFVLGLVINALKLNLFQYDLVMRVLLVVAGAYGSYALGANNVANATGAFVGAGMLTVQMACIVGGIAIALGVLTFSRGVMMTVGEGLVKLDAFSAFVVVAAEALTVHIYAMVGVPVSTSQAVVGAVLGIGVLKGVRTVNWRMLRNIFLAWLSTPLISFAITFAAVWTLDRLGWG